MPARKDRFLYPDSVGKHGDYLVAYGLGKILQQDGVEEALQEIKLRFQRTYISSLFINSNPHIVFQPERFNDTIFPLLAVNQVKELIHSPEVLALPPDEQNSLKLRVLRALVRNYELYQLVRDKKGTLLRWGRSTNEEDIPANEIKPAGSKWTRGLDSYLSELAQGRIVTWWSRLNVSMAPHYAGGTVLRKTYLDIIKKNQSHFIGKDVHEPHSLVLIKK